MTLILTELLLIVLFRTDRSSANLARVVVFLTAVLSRGRLWCRTRKRFNVSLWKAINKEGISGPVGQVRTFPRRPVCGFKDAVTADLTAENMASAGDVIGIPSPR